MTPPKLDIPAHRAIATIGWILAALRRRWGAAPRLACLFDA